jgi:DNA invertase Pin-like site-specific DNA recombinase
MVAEMERRFILKRPRAGIEAAKKKGVYKGHKPSVPVEEVRKLKREGKDAGGGLPWPWGSP